MKISAKYTYQMAMAVILLDNNRFYNHFNAVKKYHLNRCALKFEIISSLTGLNNIAIKRTHWTDLAV